MMWGYGYGWSWGGALMMLLYSLFWLALLGVLLWALLRLITSRSQGGNSTASGQSGPSALEILQQRYARGEIDWMTFDQMRERIESGEPSRQRELTPAR